jgi:hypothetical protein
MVSHSSTATKDKMTHHPGGGKARTGELLMRICISPAIFCWTAGPVPIASRKVLNQKINRWVEKIYQGG